MDKGREGRAGFRQQSCGSCKEPKSLLEEEMGQRDVKGEDLLREIVMFYSEYFLKQKEPVEEGAEIGSRSV